MTRTTFMIATSLAIVLVASPQGSPAAGVPTETTGVEAQWRKLNAEFYAAKKTFEAEREKASEERKAEIARKILAIPQEYAPRFLEFAKSKLTDENAFGPLFWIAIEVREGKYFDESLVLLKRSSGFWVGVIWCSYVSLFRLAGSGVNPLREDRRVHDQMPYAANPARNRWFPGNRWRHARRADATALQPFGHPSHAS